jgi:hypothetical protein
MLHVEMMFDALDETARRVVVDRRKLSCQSLDVTRQSFTIAGHCPATTLPTVNASRLLL